MKDNIPVAARELGLTASAWEVRDAEAFENVFAASKQRTFGWSLRPRRPADAVLIKKRIVGFALKSRLPSVHPNREAVDAGGLMSYGADQADIYRRAATYIDKILKGAKPGDLPVEQPTKFELAINLENRQADRPHHPAECAGESGSGDQMMVVSSRWSVVSLLLSAMLFAFGFPAGAQQPRLWRIGVMHVGLDHVPPSLEPLRQELKS